MRIRSIKPEFWRSEDVDALSWEERLLFIGLWSYVDDNGVGRDKLAEVAADLFAGDLEANPPETFARVSRGLQQLAAAGRITRYTVDGRAYLHVTNWERHQRIDRPNKPRYPLPTCENAEPREDVARVSRESHETPAPGTGEQGNRGTEVSTASADAEREFDAFWAAYPRKKDKGHGRKAYRAARKKADHATIMAALQAASPVFARRQPEHVPYPATWLNSEPWEDQPDSPTGPGELPPPPSSDLFGNFTGGRA